jgi:hypothetical protein
MFPGDEIATPTREAPAPIGLPRGFSNRPLMLLPSDRQPFVL